MTKPTTTPTSPDSDKALATLGHPAVQKHLDILQGIINRLAQNSGTCKNWCITLVAGVLVLAFSKEVPDATRKLVPLIACMPIAIFWGVDAYYHSLERAFRKQFLSLVTTIHEGMFSSSVVLMISDTRPRGRRFLDTLAVAFSTAATTGFYVALLISAVLVRALIL